MVQPNAKWMCSTNHLPIEIINNERDVRCGYERMADKDGLASFDSLEFCLETWNRNVFSVSITSELNLEELLPSTDAGRFFFRISKQ